MEQVHYARGHPWYAAGQRQAHFLREQGYRLERSQISQVQSAAEIFWSIRQDMKRRVLINYLVSSGKPS